MKKDTRDGSGLIVGVDLGDRFSRYCVLDQEGQVLKEDSVATMRQGRMSDGVLIALFDGRVSRLRFPDAVEATGKRVSGNGQLGDSR